MSSPLLRLLWCLLAAALTLWADPSAAHVDLTEPPMRGGNQKTGPCEGAQRGEPTTFEAGSTITMSWTETVDHPGSFIISFDPDGDDFDGDGDGNHDFPASVNGNDEASGAGELVLVEIPDEGGMQHTAEVTLPNVACDDCTLQLIQNMGERQPSGMNPTAHLYFRCVDVVLTPGTGGSGGMGGSAMGGSSGSLGDAGGGMVPLGGGGSTMGGAGSLPGPGGSGSGGSDSGGSAPVGVPAMPLGGMTMVPVSPQPMPEPVVNPSPGGVMPPPVNMNGAGGASEPPPPGGPSPTSSTAPTSSAPETTDDTGGEEGGCFGRVSPAPAGPGAAWVLLALALLGWGRRRAAG